MRKAAREIRGVFWAVIAVFAVFLAVPMATLVWQSLRVEGQFGIENYTDNILSAGFAEAFGNSVLVSGASAVITTVLAFLLAYTVNNTSLPQRLRQFISAVAVVPMFLPTITYGFVIIYAFGRQGLITRLLGDVQILDIYGPYGMLLGYVIYTLPIAFLLINNTCKYVDKNFAVVSKVMGDSTVRRFLMTAVRPLVGTLGAAFIQSFTLCFTDFGIPASIGGQFDVVAIRLYNEMLGSIPNFGGGSTIAMMMLLPSVVSITLIGYLERYNFRYNKISKQEVTKNRLRDILCATGSVFVLTVVMMVFAVMFIVPFVKSWPYETRFTLEHFLRILSSPNLTRIYFNTLIVASLTAVFGTLLSFGASLVTARSEMSGKYKSIISSIALITNTIPGMVLGIAYVFAFSGTCLQNTFAILVISNIIHYFSTPYLMGKSSLEKMNKTWENTASLMGDSWFKTLFRIIMPNSLGTLVEMFSYYFVNSMITVSAIIFLVGALTSVMTTQIKSLQHLAKFDEIFVMSLLILATNVLVRLVLGKIGTRKRTQST